MTASALTPTLEAVFAALQDATLLAVLTGGLFGDVPEDPDYPFGWIEIVHEVDRRGFGTGGLPELQLRTHVFDAQKAGASTAQEGNRQIVALLKDAALTVSGYTQCGRVFYDDTVPLPNQELNGVKVFEIVSNFRIYAEE